MAEYLLRKRLGGNQAWRTASAGLAAAEGLPASEPAVDILRERGIDLRPHRSQPVTSELIDAAAVIVVMTAGHREQLRAIAPRAREKTFLLRSFHPAGGGDIEDPIGRSAEAYREVRDEIESSLPGLAEFMESLQFD
jgi:protein-tyrosine-phosphatase